MTKSGPRKPRRHILNGRKGYFIPGPTKCPYGHPYSGENLVMMKCTTRGYKTKYFRVCRTCQRRARRAYNHGGTLPADQTRESTRDAEDFTQWICKAGSCPCVGGSREECGCIRLRNGHLCKNCGRKMHQIWMSTGAHVGKKPYNIKWKEA